MTLLCIVNHDLQCVFFYEYKLSLSPPSPPSPSLVLIPAGQRVQQHIRASLPRQAPHYASTCARHDAPREYQGYSLQAGETKLGQVDSFFESVASQKMNALLFVKLTYWPKYFSMAHSLGHSLGQRVTHSLKTHVIQTQFSLVYRTVCLQKKTCNIIILCYTKWKILILILCPWVNVDRDCMCLTRYCAHCVTRVTVQVMLFVRTSRGYGMAI